MKEPSAEVSGKAFLEKNKPSAAYPVQIFNPG
jgi:hypothetical protein